jgi:beta-mannosidase
MIHQWPDVPRLPARKIYEQVLPDAVAKWTHGAVPYHPGSPYAEGCLTIAPDGREICDTADPTMGDVHQWEIWGGRERPYQEYDKRGGRFVRYAVSLLASIKYTDTIIYSEFGIPALPSLATVEDFYFDKSSASQEDRHPQSKALAQHCRAGAFERRFAIVLYENIRFTADLET